MLCGIWHLLPTHFPSVWEDLGFPSHVLGRLNFTKRKQNPLVVSAGGSCLTPDTRKSCCSSAPALLCSYCLGFFLSSRSSPLQLSLSSCATGCLASSLLPTRPLSLGAPLLLCPGSTISSLSGLKLSKWQAHCQVLFSHLSLHLTLRCFLLSMVTDAEIASAPSLISHEFETWHLVAFSHLSC